MNDIIKVLEFELKQATKLRIDAQTSILNGGGEFAEKQFMYQDGIVQGLEKALTYLYLEKMKGKL